MLACQQTLEQGWLCIYSRMKMPSAGMLFVASPVNPTAFTRAQKHGFKNAFLACCQPNQCLESRMADLSISRSDWNSCKLDWRNIQWAAQQCWHQGLGSHTWEKCRHLCVSEVSDIAEGIPPSGTGEHGLQGPAAKVSLGRIQFSTAIICSVSNEHSPCISPQPHRPSIC